MRFEYEETTRSATDHENNIKVWQSSKFFDTDHLNFEYADDHLEFVFAAFEARQRCIVTVGGTAMESLLPIAMYVVELTVKQGARVSPIPIPSRQARYPEVRRAVEYGMFALCTEGGKLLKRVPDYRVEYIPDFSNIPRLRF